MRAIAFVQVRTASPPAGQHDRRARHGAEPVKIHLENPLLGKDCYVGSSLTPITPP